jgi:hypothetical protein
MRGCRCQLGVERGRRNPAPGGDFSGVDHRLGPGSSCVDRAQLVFGADVAEAGGVFELVQKPERRTQPEFLFEAASYRQIHCFAGPWMAAAAVRPVQRPQAFVGVSLLQ